MQLLAIVWQEFTRKLTTLEVIEYDLYCLGRIDL